MNYFVHQDFKVMLEEAYRADDMYKNGTYRPFEGVPVGVKDNVDVVGDGPTTACTAAFMDNKPKFEGALWKEKFRLNGAISAGKLTMCELAFGTVSNSKTFGTARSAWDTERTAGGSSGGSGGAVGAGIVPIALGTDTGGSIRIPAACNGIVGYRPTVNRWPSDYGVMISPTLDSIGPLALSVRDVCLLDSIVTGEKEIETHLKPSDVRIGVPRSNSFYEDLDPLISH